MDLHQNDDGGDILGDKDSIELTPRIYHAMLFTESCIEDESCGM